MTSRRNRSSAATLGRTATLGVGALLLSGCYWTGYGFGWEKSGHNPFEENLGPAEVGALEESWRVSGVDGVTGTPTVFDGSVYFGAWDGAVRSVDVETGAVEWATPLTAGTIDGSVTVSGDRLYVGDADGELHALDRATGAVDWTAVLDPHPNTQIYSSPVVVGDLVIIGVASTELAIPKSDYTFRGSVVALDATSGAEVWRTYVTNDDASGGAGGSVWSSAAVDARRGLLYIGTGQSYEEPASSLTDSLLALDIETGDIEWSRQFTEGDVFTFWNMAGPDADIGAAPNLFRIGDRDVVGVGDKAGHYVVFDRDTGEAIWMVELPEGERLGGIMTTAAVADGTVYVSSNRWGPNLLDFHDPAHESTTYALDAATGEQLWATDLPSPAFNAISLADGVVYQTSVQGTVYALDAADGAVLWRDEPGADLGGGVSIVGGTVYVGYGFWFIGAPENPAGGVVAYSLPETGGS
ncbi:MAG TPA: PQQ-binding-like beta-propeller repeat protein [Acidimicrobiales bacterium]|nr:PQQ-binding-like beta-propeller repeat protein [Acidimicrobiales bacterium]